ncbi:MAG TPA: penicillin acylase family protein [Vicinamibacterales bacterium]|nr:penicillin acylase family protein [Vicinamibacterales bacterium]
MQFDRFAVPHVLARSDADAWRAVGYLQARDRLWQMELYRRAASGRLSELLGEATVAIDQRFLTLGLRLAAEREWQRTPADVRTAFESFAAGVNAAMPAARGERPLELQLLGVTPEPWTPIDSLAISKLFAWRLGENHRAELLRYALLQEMGPRALALFPHSPGWAPVILQRPVRSLGALGALGAVGASGALGAKGATYPPGLEWLSPDAHAMSNSWVVHGSRTASGRPILANDPHLAIEMPSVWWEAHVVSDSLNVAGVTIPGIPFVVIGHNARIGWGLTNVGSDVQDFFVEQLDPSRQRYRVGEEWVPLEIRRHEIRVSGRGEPLVFEVRSTRHGPIRNADDWHEAYAGDPELPSQLDETVLALKWHPVLEGTAAAAFDALARATDWTSFVDAVRAFSAPAQNFVYADVDGNIGYAMSGLLPIRTGSDGSLPVPGAPRDADWQSFVEMTQLPAVVNPPSGQFVTANNEVDRGLPYFVTRDWVAPFRSERITQLLGNRRGLDVAAMRQIQADITSLSADLILKSIDVPDTIKELRTWDRRVDGRAVSLVYEAFEEALWWRTFADEMPAPLYGRFYRYAANERFAGLHSVIGDARSPWFDDRSTPNVVETRDDTVREAAADALAGLRARFGDPAGWRWDEAHAVKFSHPLSGGGRVLDWFFSRGPVPVAGDSMTVNKTTTDLRRPYATTEAASYRQILDVGAWDGSLGVNTTGQSGHPRSPHYFDQNRLWRQGEYRPLPFTRGAVDAATVSTLVLVP